MRSDSQHSIEGVTSAVNNCIDKMFNNDDTNKDDYDPPTDISLNVTTDAETSLQRSGRVTPLHTALTPPKVNKRKKAATPMPVYAELPTPEIMVRNQVHITLTSTCSRLYCTYSAVITSFRTIAIFHWYCDYFRNKLISMVCESFPRSE